MYNLIKKDGEARRGTVSTSHGVFQTPAFMPVGTYGAVKSLSPEILKQIDAEIKKAEQEINFLKKSAPEKINKIAIETSSVLIKKLLGAEVNNSSISAIVDDLSKKNGDKYYGN